MKIARVFPRQTNATPGDDLVFINCPPPWDDVLPEFDEVHISVAFTYDKKQAEFLAEAWRAKGKPVKIGGPAFNDPRMDDDRPFEPGLYIKSGFTITSRGCPNHCWFCRVGNLHELEIKDGYNILDDNLLACSDQHIKAAFAMLARQPQRPEFTGGLEAKILKPWHCEEMRKLNPTSMYFAYDTPDDLEPLIQAGKMLQSVGFKVSDHNIRCYVLMGYKGDTYEKANKRCFEAIDAGFMPFGMLYRNEQGIEKEEWIPFQREWANPYIVGSKMAKRLKEAR